MTPKSAFTYRDYEALPNDGRRYEIHDGELCVTPAPSLEHQMISARLSFQLMKWLETRPGGLLLYAPLAVQILSPSTRRIDRVTKTRLYARYGVPFLWLVDPDARTIEAFALEGTRYALAVAAAGPEPVDLPPFTGLGLVPDALWP